jgi:aryl-alcohol dehydrogenase-like predicted oxidoreductase
MTAPLPHRASPAGTILFADRHPGADFYRAGWDGLTVSSLGLGTYLGEPDPATDARYTAAVRRYLQLGGNLLDTAINYRFQRSERAIKQALKASFAVDRVPREAIVVCTKGGYLPFDGDWPANPQQWIHDTFIATGIIQPDDIVDGHCMAPAYLRHQIAQSRANLGLGCIDLYYLHNPEGQRALLGEDAFRHRLREAFAALEVAVAQGEIAAYGTATWNGYRAAASAPDYLTLEAVLAVARDVAGDRHHFRAVQLPFNLQMLEAARQRNQPAAAGLVSLLEAAADNNVAVIASASLLQGRLLGRLPEALQAQFDRRLEDPGRALQFVRSAPGVTAALAGMSRPEHVEENMTLAQVAPMDPAAWRGLFGKR